jgi:hypothetical protein
MPVRGCDSLPIDLSRAAFRARIYRVSPGRQAATLGLSIHHLVLDGPSQQIVYEQVLRLLAAERKGEQLALRPYDARSVVRDAILDHVQTLNEKWPAAKSLVPELTLDPSLKRSPIGAKEMQSVTQYVSKDVMTRATAKATSNSLTLNALLLGSLASILHKHSHQSQFAIAQTYLARRPDQLQAVGSYSKFVPMAFSFETQTSLLDTCSHVLRETLEVLKEGASGATSASPSFAYELNDVRPIPRPTLQQLATSNGFDLVKDIFFVVSQYADGYVLTCMHDTGVYSSTVVEVLVEEWMQLWLNEW